MNPVIKKNIPETVKTVITQCKIMEYSLDPHYFFEQQFSIYNMSRKTII